MRKQRAPDLTEATISIVVDLLDGWTGKLTWDLLIAEVLRLTGFEYSRFTFADYPGIANSFALKKKKLSGTLARGPRTPRDGQILAALDKAERFKAKADRLERENELLLEQFKTWAVNAERHGVTVAKLNAPLALPNRERSKKAR
ncbi:hypothetical protein ACS5PN_12510 [Roseateles sp. NT4]|uniref:hypothetical protein n=1 Tax=Roseateles sp. NT4 TaxID=3453715 RepID=UPI003EEEC485